VGSEAEIAQASRYLADYVEAKAAALNRKPGKEAKQYLGKKIFRPDHEARREMIAAGKVLASGWGVPHGVAVGTLSPDRAALIVLGLHKETMAGIAFAKHCGHSFAQSIVVSGGYENDVDDFEVDKGATFEYTGQGGNDFLGSKLQTEDQRLKRGNLALANCKVHSLPVRVLRKVQSNSREEFRYDGLYFVTDYREDTADASDVASTKVFKFSMERLPGQPSLSSEQSVGFRTSRGGQAEADDAEVKAQPSAEVREYAAWKKKYQAEQLAQARRSGSEHARISDKQYRRLFAEHRAGARPALCYNGE